jgi:hypothetical protein
VVQKSSASFGQCGRSINVLARDVRAKEDRLRVLSFRSSALDHRLRSAIHLYSFASFAGNPAIEFIRVQHAAINRSHNDQAAMKRNAIHRRAEAMQC